jgi:hypothetical protein
MEVDVVVVPAQLQFSTQWLASVVAALGEPVKDPDLMRWTWRDGDVGVFIDQLTHAWQTVAWTPEHSVTLRGRRCPNDIEVYAVVSLARLTKQRPTGDPA